jgi:hypothetical protein
MATMINLSSYINATAMPVDNAAGGLVPIELRLEFTMQAQTQSNWCWAATSASVSLYYKGVDLWTQCNIATLELNRACCNMPVPGACNVPWYLDRALSRTGHFSTMQNGALTFDVVRGYIDTQRIVGVRTAWAGGGAHFIVIYGYKTSTAGINYFHIDDPIYGKSIYSENEFNLIYQGSGTWTHSYITQA